MARLKDFYKDSVVKSMTEQFGYTSVMQVPRIDKITLNMGVGEAVAEMCIRDRKITWATLWVTCHLVAA